MWVFNSIEVWTRLWMNWRIGRRTYRGTLVMARETCSRIRTMASPVVCSSDEMKYYAVSLRRVFAVAGVHVQVDNRYSGGRLMRTNSKLMTGPQWRYEQARSRSEDSKKPNTSYVERLQLTLRRGCSYLHRRTNGPMRNRWRLAESVAILHCYYNFVRRHASLRFGKVVRTPAMQAGICDRALTFRDIFSWCPRPVARPSLLPVT
ncbi:MAG: hypothetical protein K8S98_09585 [Planctomycetes bacterium]|nr:hypothetical protein [Planctomycetota bacterium]